MVESDRLQQFNLFIKELFARDKYPKFEVQHCLKRILKYGTNDRILIAEQQLRHNKIVITRDANESINI